jgi:hypothetical protein
MFVTSNSTEDRVPALKDPTIQSAVQISYRLQEFSFVNTDLREK